MVYNEDIAFAVIEHSKNYYEFYYELLDYITEYFPHTESGIQGDAYIWIKYNEHRVSVDTFGAMQFEIKSDSKNTLLQDVIETIQKKYPVRLYDTYL